MAKPLSHFVILVSILSTIVYLLERNLKSFYIFKTDHIHDLAKRGIAAHGNDTRAIVEYIVTELQEMYPDNVNLNQEWFFNNHGGAMGSMFNIHASRKPSHHIITSIAYIVSRYNRVFDHLRLSCWYRGTLGTAHGRRLLPHPDGRGVGIQGRCVRAGDLPSGLGTPLAPRRCQGIQDPRALLGARVCAGVDSAHDVLWLWRCCDEYTRDPDHVTYYGRYVTGDDEKFACGQILISARRKNVDQLTRWKEKGINCQFVTI